MKYVILTLLCMAFTFNSIQAADFDNTKIYQCSGVIGGKTENFIYDARVNPETDCQKAAEMAVGFAKGFGNNTINAEEVKKNCILQYKTDKEKALKLNQQGKCKEIQAGTPVWTNSN